ncbi:hypothetical protein A3C91_00605 [Candidatus Azambacteria bacterium RIFCSPHIGHO2_02_FULL_52_12]|uniref:Mercury ion transport protein n=1 Tax=Candidatus Azambacteria bacterium RIFCSPLOWO2_01_FULL_46_25 TaxID=1797298 RepID=A0A1F5BTM6_9BACT|nr:MAG: hypothetical protein A3C91_00605 [Candidatus Azambacteria bacterium RIFCSPHIGHO2_02_FULL_52_12]OGD33948.1 MAG: hypothetical protein A2988_00445 [Candidatus Azambacteria bacterium RIFCSPLOWO2_01_FULL_46_25]OGD37634.1 MAG: hypothetical protein A2850_04520 [Candidatus Azambacteria bacterium RIFCSPHIGHO2_01_FULL_51_74]
MFKDILKISGLPVLVATLCCLSPVIIVLAGLGSVAFASSLADTLYGDYKWYFRAAGLLLLTASMVFYLRRTKGICTIDEAVKRRNEVINIVILSLVAGILGYILVLYGVVHYIGAFMGLWSY